MRQFTCYIGTAAYPVISYRRKTRYVNGTESNIKDSCYTVLSGYDQVDITVPDDGNVVTYEQIKEAADAGTPLEMEFHELEITARAKDKWEIQVRGRATQTALVKSK